MNRKKSQPAQPVIMEINPKCLYSKSANVLVSYNSYFHNSVMLVSSVRVAGCSLDCTECVTHEKGF